MCAIVLEEMRSVTLAIDVFTIVGIELRSDGIQTASVHQKQQRREKRKLGTHVFRKWRSVE